MDKKLCKKEFKNNIIRIMGKIEEREKGYKRKITSSLYKILNI